jgi:hypothetical protein
MFVSWFKAISELVFGYHGLKRRHSALKDKVLVLVSRLGEKAEKATNEMLPIAAFYLVHSAIELYDDSDNRISDSSRHTHYGIECIPYYIP